MKGKRMTASMVRMRELLRYDFHPSKVWDEIDEILRGREDEVEGMFKKLEKKINRLKNQVEWMKSLNTSYQEENKKLQKSLDEIDDIINPKTDLRTGLPKNLKMKGDPLQQLWDQYHEDRGL